MIDIDRCGYGDVGNAPIQTSEAADCRMNGTGESAAALIACCGNVSIGLSVGGSHDNNNGGDGSGDGSGGRRWAKMGRQGCC